MNYRRTKAVMQKAALRFWRSTAERKAGSVFGLTVFERNRAVEDQMIRSAVGIRAEVALTQELISGSSFSVFGQRRVFQAGLHLAARENRKAVRIQAIHKILFAAFGIGIPEQIIIKTDFGVLCGGFIHPVQGCAANFTTVGRIAAAAFRVICTENFGHIAVCIM